MFTLFRYGLLPVVLYCCVVIAAGIDAYSTNAVQKASWPQTIVTVVESKDPLGEAFAEFRGTPNTFPDPYGTLTYVADGKAYTWQGRGREIGLTAMNPGDEIKVYYNPENPQEISTLVLLGAFTGNIILAVALAFLAFYVWFFWLRRFTGRPTPPDDFGGDLAKSFAGSAPAQHPDQVQRSRFAPEDGPAGKSSSPGHRPFGKRQVLRILMD